MKKEEKIKLLIILGGKIGGGVGDMQRDNPLSNPSFDMLPKTQKSLKWSFIKIAGFVEECEIIKMKKEKKIIIIIFGCEK